MMNIAVCAVEATNATTITESPFPKIFPRFFYPFDDGYLFASESKLFHHKGEDVDDPTVVFEKPVTSLAITEDAVFLVSGEQLWQSAPQPPLEFAVVNCAALQSISVVQVACGQSHTLVLTSKGDVISRGRGAACGLGLAAGVEEKEFTKIQGLSNVFFIAAGDTHSAAVRNAGPPDVDGRIRPMRKRQSASSVLLRQRRIDETFVRGVVMMSREESKAKQGALAVDGKDPLADLETKPRIIESEVSVWGKGVGVGLGLDKGEINQPVPLPNLEAVVQLACGARHTVALTVAGQVFVWGEYFPGRTEHEPSGIQLSAHQYVMEVAAGFCLTMACAYIQNKPKIYVVDENKCWQQRGGVLNANDNPRLYQGLACHRSEPHGYILVVADYKHPFAPDTKAHQLGPESIGEERHAIHLLNYNIMNQVRHLYNLRRQFSNKWKTSAEVLEKENNVIKTFADMLDSILKMVDSGQKLSWHLSKQTCLLPSLAQEEKLADVLREFCDISCFFRSLFNDLLAFGCFQTVYDKYKQEMVAVIAGMLESKVKRADESNVPKYLIHEFEKGISTFEDLMLWKKTLKDNEALTAVIDELERKNEKLLSDISVAEQCAALVAKHLSVVRTEFFAPKRRIRQISCSSHIQFTTAGDLGKTREKILVLTGEEFILVANRKLYVWNYQAVWLDKYSQDTLTVDVVLPETRITLKANSPHVLEEWLNVICEGISQRFSVECTVQDGVPNRRFEYKFLMDGRTSCCKMGDSYNGSWENGKMHGDGQYLVTKKEGREVVQISYTGEFVLNERCGYGKSIKDFPDGRSEIVFGAWEENQLHGYAEERHSRGSLRNSLDEEEEPTMRYEGCFNRSQRHGLGRLEQWEGNQKLVYLGNWHNHKRCGYGIQSLGDRAFFGEFKADKETELGYTINYCTGDIVSTTWINGSNFRYQRKDDGTGELTYKIGGYDVQLIGKIDREPHEGKWIIKNGTFSVETTKEIPSLFGNEDFEDSVSEKWRALVDECKQMLVGDPPVDNPWTEYLPSKLRHKDDNIKSLQPYIERFAALYTTGGAEENLVTEEDWRLMKEFAVQIRDNYTSFALTLFLKRRTEVFSFFIGINNRDRLENLVLEELEELVRDTYSLLHCLFPALPKRPNKRATNIPRSSGYDLVLAILPLTFYQELMTIFAAFTTDAKQKFMKFCKKMKPDKDFLVEDCCFPSQTHDLVNAILDDLESRPPPRSPGDIKISTSSRESTYMKEVHVADIIEKVSETFSASKTIDGEEAFRLLGVMEEVYESSSQFIKQVHGNFGADEMSSFLYFILWKARPENLDLHIFLVRHLTKHYKHYDPYGKWDYVLTSFSVVFESICSSSQRV